MIFHFNVEFNKNQLLNAVLQNLAAHPATPVQGFVYWNTTDKTVYAYDGTQWLDLGGDIRDVAKAANSPISVNIANGIATIDIDAATTTARGSMSAADKAKLDNATASNTPSTLVMRDASGNVILNGVSASSMTVGATAQNPTDVVNWQTLVNYVQGGTKYKGTVKVATTANITLSGLQTHNGVSILADDLVLVWFQTNPIQNGIYQAKSGAWVRHTSMAVGSSASGSHIIVEQGAEYNDSVFICTSDSGSDVVGTNNLAFSRLPNSVQVDNVTIEFAGGALRLKDGGITGSKLSSSIFGAGLTFVGGVLSVTGYTPLAGATVARDVLWTGQIGGGSAVVITHNLNNSSPKVAIWDATTNNEICARVAATSANAVSITANGTLFNVRIGIFG